VTCTDPALLTEIASALTAFAESTDAIAALPMNVLRAKRFCLVMLPSSLFMKAEIFFFSLGSTSFAMIY